MSKVTNWNGYILQLPLQEVIIPTRKMQWSLMCDGQIQHSDSRQQKPIKEIKKYFWPEILENDVLERAVHMKINYYERCGQ